MNYENLRSINSKYLFEPIKYTKTINYFDPTKLMPIDNINNCESTFKIYNYLENSFYEIGNYFGFQDSNIANQHEHIAMLLSNIHSEIMYLLFVGIIF